MAFNFDEFLQWILEKLKQSLSDPNSDHPLKQFFSMDDINRLAENPLSMEDISKFLKYFAEDPNFKKFFAKNPFYPNYSPPAPPQTPSTKKAAPKVNPDADLIFDSFEFGDEVHILIGTNRTDLEFKTGVKKSNPKDLALIVRDKQGAIVQVIQLPHTINRKTKRVTYQNGTYEIIYNKK